MTLTGQYAQKEHTPAAPLSSGLKCVPLPFFLHISDESPFAPSVCKRKGAAIPAVSYDNSVNNRTWCPTAAAHNDFSQTNET